jgi:long-chain fatty acid transport protein
LKTTKRLQITGLFPLFCLLCGLAHPGSVFALGIRLPDQDAFATARGNAFAATANDPSAIYYNPAGLTQLEGMNLSVGMYGITLASRYTGPTQSINSQQEWAALPRTFTTLSLTNYHLAFGLGVYEPYGLSMEWPHKAPWLKPPSTQSSSGEIDYIRVNPVVAWQPCDTFSIAAGVMLDYSQAELETDFNGPPYNIPGTTLHGRDTDVGFNAAILWHPLPQHSFGLLYRSATDMDYNGHVSFQGLPLPSQQARLNFHLPQTVTGGYSYRPTTNWNLEVDADWTDWSSLRDTTIQTGTGPIGALDFNWKPSSMYEFGVTRYFGSGWRASAGYMYSENSVPDSYFMATIPDSDRHLFSVGLGQTCKHLTWDAAYQLGIGPSRSVSGDTNPAYNGSYEFLSNALSFDIGWHF